MKAGQIAELRKLLEKATPGPWIAYSYEGERPLGTHRFSVCREPDGPAGDSEGHVCVASVLSDSEAQAEISAHVIATFRNSADDLIRLAEFGALAKAFMLEHGKPMREALFEAIESFDDALVTLTLKRFVAARDALELLLSAACALGKETP